MPPIAVFVALADPTRCRIIEILRSGPLPVHQIAATFDISRPAISRHLSVLKQARLISEKKLGRENRYELHTKRLKPAQDWMATIVAAKAAPAAAPATARRKPKSVPVLTPPSAPATTGRRVSGASQMGFDF